MSATQSHGFQFDGFPATRFAWNGRLNELAGAAFGFIDCCFTAVILGIIETALDTARAQLQQKRDMLRPFESTEWARAETEGWLIIQAYEGMLRAVERNENAGRAVLQGKVAVSELAESVMTRLCRVIGGNTFSRRSPYGRWFEDVRALGFLRPPWALAYDRLFDLSLPKPNPAP